MAKAKDGGKLILALGVSLVAVILFAFNFLAQTASGGGENVVVDVQLSPNSLARWGKEEWVIANVGVARGEVIGSTLRLNNVGAVKTGADAVGNLVAYFDHDMVRDSLVENWEAGPVELVLTGDLWDGGELIGSDSVTLE